MNAITFILVAVAVIAGVAFLVAGLRSQTATGGAPNNQKQLRAIVDAAKYAGDDLTEAMAQGFADYRRLIVEREYPLPQGKSNAAKS